MKVIKYVILLFLSLSFFACDSKSKRTQKEQSQEKYIELGEQVRDISCTSKEFKKCFEEYLDDELTVEELSRLEDIFDTYFIFHRKNQITIDAAVLGMKIELNIELFNINFDNKDVTSPNLYKLSRLAELEEIIIQIIES